MTMDGDQYDAPNQQVVRPDGSGPWDEGTGGSSGDTEPEPVQESEESEDSEQSEESEEASTPVKSGRRSSRRT
jgi:hypothetical protein